MTWNDLDTKGDNAEAQRMREAHAAKVNELSQAAVRALGPAQQAPLVEWLRATALSYSYASGRSAEDVAFAEGRRQLAVELLKLGGSLNESGSSSD